MPASVYTYQTGFSAKSALVLRAGFPNICDRACSENIHNLLYNSIVFCEQYVHFQEKIVICCELDSENKKLKVQLRTAERKSDGILFSLSV